MSLYHNNGAGIVCVLQAKPEHSSIALPGLVYVAILFSELSFDNADHRIINLSVSYLANYEVYRLLPWLLYNYVYDRILASS